MTELWIKLTDTGWGYRPGHATAHFMLLFDGASGNGPEVHGWVAACGQVLASPEDTPFKAGEELARCGRCIRSVNIHPDWQPVLLSGSWSPALGSTRQHQWIYDASKELYVSRCGIERLPKAMGRVQSAILTDENVVDPRHLPDCQKCIDYLEIDERKRPETTTLNDEGRTVSVKMMAGEKPAYNIGDEWKRRIKMSEKNETLEKQEIRFNFTVEGLDRRAADDIMDLVRDYLRDLGLELGGGFLPYKDEPDPRDAVVEVLKKKEIIRWFANNNGGMETHRAWRDNMLKAGRKVAPKRMQWETLDLMDQELDRQISYDVIMDFSVWIQEHALEALETSDVEEKH